MITNIFILAAGLCGWRHAVRNGVLTVGTGLMLTTIIAIGLGSIVFHIYPVRLTLVMDVAPITLFQFIFLWLYLKKAFSASFTTSAVICAVVALLIVFSYRFLDYINASSPYLPALVVLSAMVIWFRHTKGKWDLTVVAALLLFSVALIFRTIDNALCVYGVGTHFIWHTLNGIVLYLFYLTIANTISKPSPHAIRS